MKILKNCIPLFIIIFTLPVFAFSQQTAEDFYRQAVELSKKGKYDAAIASMDEAVKIRSDYVEAYLERSRFKQNNQRDIKGASADIEIVLQLDPQLGAAYYERSQIRKSQFSEILETKKNMSFEETLPFKKLELEDLNSAINYGYKNKQVYLLRAFLYWKTFVNFPKAIEDFTVALEYDPEDYDLYNTRGLVKRDTGDLPGAIADMREIINIYERLSNDKKYPANKQKRLKDTAVMMFNNLSSLYSESEDSTSQLWAIKKSLEIEPTSQGYAALGRYKVVFGEFDDAIADYTKAIEISDGRLPLDFVRRGIAYHLQGKLEKAQADFDKALEIAPNMRNNIKYQIEVTCRQREQKRIRIELP